MEKMRATFYVLAVLGALLEPLLAETETSNTTGASVTNTPGLQNQNPVENNSSVDVSNVTEVYDVNITRAENASISSTQMPPMTENSTEGIPSDVDVTTNGMKDEQPTKPKRSTTTSMRTPKPTESHAEPQKMSVYVVVLIVVILGVAVIAIVFFCVKSNRKRFSVDIHTKHEDAQIPLASVEPEMCEIKDTDMKTFPSGASSPADRQEKTEEQKGPIEAGQQVTESPVKTQTTEAPAEKEPKPIVSDGADPTASTKTSVETLNDVLNENNSNNNAVRDVSGRFIEICLQD